MTAKWRPQGLRQRPLRSRTQGSLSWEDVGTALSRELRTRLQAPAAPLAFTASFPRKGLGSPWAASRTPKALSPFGKGKPGPRGERAPGPPPLTSFACGLGEPESALSLLGEDEEEVRRGHRGWGLRKPRWRTAHPRPDAQAWSEVGEREDPPFLPLLPGSRASQAGVEPQVAGEAVRNPPSFDARSSVGSWAGQGLGQPRGPGGAPQDGCVLLDAPGGGRKTQLVNLSPDPCIWDQLSWKWELGNGHLGSWQVPGAGARPSVSHPLPSEGAETGPA